MRKTNVGDLKPTALYKLQDVFEAVCKDIGLASDELRECPAEYQKGMIEARRNSLKDVADQLMALKEEGATFIMADAPFSDNNLTGSVTHCMSAQFKSGNVRPVKGMSVDFG